MKNNSSPKPTTTKSNSSKPRTSKGNSSKPRTTKINKMKQIEKQMRKQIKELIKCDPSYKFLLKYLQL